MSTARGRSTRSTPEGDRALPDTPGPGGRESSRLWVTAVSVGCLVLFVVLTFLVVSGVAQPLDEQLVRQVRPGDVWAESQVRFSPWMHRLRPTRMYGLLACTCVALSAWRRSWRPLVLGLVLAVVSVALVLLVKIAVERPDPHGALASSGGSYPSGHVVAVLVCLGGCLLALRPRVRWWFWGVPAAAAGLMTAALVISAAHWPSDVLGGALLACALVTAASRWAPGEPTDGRAG